MQLCTRWSHIEADGRDRSSAGPGSKAREGSEAGQPPGPTPACRTCSLAALITPVMVPPARPAAYASFMDGYLAWSGCLRVGRQRSRGVGQICEATGGGTRHAAAPLGWQPRPAQPSPAPSSAGGSPEGEVPHLHKVEARPRLLAALHARRPAHGVQDGQPHVGPAQLRQHARVGRLHHGVDDGLRGRGPGVGGVGSALWSHHTA